MIERFYLKDHLSFKQVDLEFDKNLIIFSGPSGAGKSILMDAFLTIFGLKDCGAKTIEAVYSGAINTKEFGIEEDEPNIFKQTKDKSARYFINAQQISKKNIKLIGSQFVNYLTLREFKEFENEELLKLLDAICLKENKNYQKVLDSFKENYQQLKLSKKELHTIEEEEKKITDLREFATFEITKIEEIDPKIGEYEELMIQKKELSHKEKIENALQSASEIFEYESKVTETLNLLNEKNDLFSESLNELRATFENATIRLNELDDLNIDQMLERLEKLSSLKTKHGSIEESLEYLAQKKEELSRYENIAFEKSELQKKVTEFSQKVDTDATLLTQKRTTALKTLSKRVEYYLKLLYLENIDYKIEEKELHHLGKDNITVTLKGTKLEKVSSGELNRIRLAALCASSEFIQENGGVLILDEIDANLSGKESMSIATVLKLLSKTYQIFAISHQPQLSSCAHMHFLVHKEDEISKVTLLQSKQERVKELSRMISGDSVSKEAIDFANSLLE